MKTFGKSLVILAIVALIGVSLYTPVYAAGDEQLNAKIDLVTTQLDVNGKPYVRFIIGQQRTLNGVKYTRTLPVMAFGDLVAKAKTYKKGDTLKCIASFRQLPDGRQSYTVIKFLK